MQFNIPQSSNSPIKVIGVGGGGSNAVNTMFEQGITGVDFIVCNTDAQARHQPVPRKFTPARPHGSLRPALAQLARMPPLKASTKSQASWVRHQHGVCHRRHGRRHRNGRCTSHRRRARAHILTVGIVTVPFLILGRRRNQQASEGLEAMRAAVDTLLIIRNDKLRGCLATKPSAAPSPTQTKSAPPPKASRKSSH